MVQRNLEKCASLHYKWLRIRHKYSLEVSGILCTETDPIDVRAVRLFGLSLERWGLKAARSHPPPKCKIRDTL